MFCTVEVAIEEIIKKKILMIQDHLNREDEGDLFIPAEYATTEVINFMITYGKGLVCVPITKKRARQLNLELMVPELQNKEYTKCNFTVSVDAKSDIRSGISAFDRTKTIQVLANPYSEPEELVKPGHIFPLIAKEGLLDERKGHTEAAIELSLLSGVDPSGVICEIIGDDGEMLRGRKLHEFARKHNIKIITIEELVKKNKYVKNNS